MAALDLPQTDPRPEEALCSQCKTVDWSSLPALAASCNPENPWEFEALQLRSFNATSKELKNSTCIICRILSTIQSSNLDKQDHVLKAIPLSYQLSYVDHRVDGASQITSLGVFAEQNRSPFCIGSTLAVMRLENNLASMKILPSLIDYDKLKSLVIQCKEKHQESCNPPQAKASVLYKVSNLKLISTETRQVVEAPSQCEYLALSYVWGKQEAENPDHDLSNAPRVVRDAILVAKSMGYSYLWVDRYVSYSVSMWDPRLLANILFFSAFRSLPKRSIK